MARTVRAALLLLVFAFSGALLAKQPVLVISVDGMDQRYLSECDKLGLKIPNLQKLMREGQWSAGVMGVVPTVTWPSHTTILTGVEPAVHGILANARPAQDGGGRYWGVEFLKVPTLLDAAHKAGLKTGSVNWPVTVGAASDFNLPTYFQRSRPDLASTSSKSNPPDLVARISRMFPSFAQGYTDDRTRTLATRYLLRAERPDLLLLHLAIMDADSHDFGPFTSEALGIMEYTDELIGSILQDVPANYAVVIVSDHGFEKVDREVHLLVVANQRGVNGLKPVGGWVVAEEPAAAQLVRELARDPTYGIGREVPSDEIRRFSPDLLNAAAVFETANGVWFGSATTGDLVTKPADGGIHGHWPTRYRAVYLASGLGIRAERIPEISLKDEAQRLAALLGIPFTPGAAK